MRTQAALLCWVSNSRAPGLRGLPPCGTRDPDVVRRGHRGTPASGDPGRPWGRRDHPPSTQSSRSGCSASKAAEAETAAGDSLRPSRRRGTSLSPGRTLTPRMSSVWRLSPSPSILKGANQRSTSAEGSGPGQAGRDPASARRGWNTRSSAAKRQSEPGATWAPTCADVVAQIRPISHQLSNRLPSSTRPSGTSGTEAAEAAADTHPAVLQPRERKAASRQPAPLPCRPPRPARFCDATTPLVEGAGFPLGAGLRADATRRGGAESLVPRSGVSAPQSGGAAPEPGCGERLQD